MRLLDLYLWFGVGFSLANQADVYLFENAERLGGHSNTVDAVFGDVSIPVDTGFIVYNPLNYPNLTSLLMSYQFLV